jgi:hypothetical protein
LSKFIVNVIVRLLPDKPLKQGLKSMLFLSKTNSVILQRLHSQD